MLQCVAVCGSLVQLVAVSDEEAFSKGDTYVAVCCSVLQCVAGCCSALQCIPVHCNVFQCVVVCGERALFKGE